MKRLYDKVALITGSSTGIGRAIAQTFAFEGAEVIVVSHNSRTEGEATAQEIIDSGEKVAEKYSSIDILVNNVGHAYSTPFDEITEATLIRDINSNLIATVLCSKKVKQYMKKGHIINTSSIRGINYAGRTHLMGYCAGKAAVDSFTKNLALQYAPDIFVNAVAPGFVWTETLSKTQGNLLKKWLGSIPIERFIKPEELAEIYVMLATSNIFTGSIIVADGGYTLLEKN